MGVSDRAMASISGPHPFSHIRAASITPAAQQRLSQSSQDLADFEWPEEERPTIPHNDYRRDRDLPVVDLSGLQMALPTPTSGWRTDRHGVLGVGFCPAHEPRHPRRRGGRRPEPN